MLYFPVYSTYSKAVIHFILQASDVSDFTINSNTCISDQDTQFYSPYKTNIPTHLDIDLWRKH